MMISCTPTIPSFKISSAHANRSLLPPSQLNLQSKSGDMPLLLRLMSTSVCLLLDRKLRCLFVTLALEIYNATVLKDVQELYLACQWRSSAPGGHRSKEQWHTSTFTLEVQLGWTQQRAMSFGFLIIRVLGFVVWLLWSRRSSAPDGHRSKEQRHTSIFTLEVQLGWRHQWAWADEILIFASVFWFKVEGKERMKGEVEFALILPSLALLGSSSPFSALIRYKYPVMKAKRLSKAQRLSLDRITTLPQSIIETILCLLPVQEAAKTSILSSEWRHKWTKIPKLVFFESTVKSPSEMKPLSVSNWGGTYDLDAARRNKDMSCKLFYAIHQVLLLRQGPIQEFALTMNAHRTYVEIDQIILHLSMNHTLNKLKLNFLDACSCYELPSYFFSLHHLTDLYLDHCYFEHTRKFNGFSNLISLTLSRVRISKETLLHVLSNCPSLKRLSLFLDSENLEGCPSIMDLFKCLPMIEHLTIWGETVLLLESVPEELPASLIHLKYCSIEQINFDDLYGLTFLAALIKCSPNLEAIKLEIGDDYYNDGPFEFEDFAAILEAHAHVWLERMNELKIECFNNSKQELEFVKFVMARSPNLKKVMLSTCISNKNEELELLRILLGAPRASPVQILVRNS
ncbi:hypothetical protein R6Q59_004804 [Mikania micrantha]